MSEGGSSRSVRAIDLVHRTDGFGEGATITSHVLTGTHPLDHGETRADGSIVCLDNPSLDAAVRHGKTWVKLDLDHLPPADSSDPGLKLLGRLGVVYRTVDPQQSALFSLAFPDGRRPPPGTASRTAP